MLIHKIYNRKIDIWSLGILMYEFLTGKPPFETWDCDQTFQMIRKSKKTLKFDGLNKQSVDLLRGLLRSNPTKRISIEEVLKHPWIIRHTK